MNADLMRFFEYNNLYKRHGSFRNDPLERKELNVRTPSEAIEK